MTDFTLWVLGLPIAQPRPKAARIGRGVRIYNPNTADAWKRGVIANLQNARCIPDEPWAGPVGVDLVFLFPRPRRIIPQAARGMILPDAGVRITVSRLDPDALPWHIQKPDRDNLDKAVLDALTIARIFRDDKQVCDGTITKQYVPLVPKE